GERRECGVAFAHDRLLGLLRAAALAAGLLGDQLQSRELFVHRLDFLAKIIGLESRFAGLHFKRAELILSLGQRGSVRGGLLLAEGLERGAQIFQFAGLFLGFAPRSVALLAEAGDLRPCFAQGGGVLGIGLLGGGFLFGEIEIFLALGIEFRSEL